MVANIPTVYSRGCSFSSGWPRRFLSCAYCSRADAFLVLNIQCSRRAAPVSGALAVPVLATKTGPGKSRCLVTNQCKSFWRIRNKKLVHFEFNDVTATRPRLSSEIPAGNEPWVATRSLSKNTTVPVPCDPGDHPAACSQFLPIIQDPSRASLRCSLSPFLPPQWSLA